MGIVHHLHNVRLPKINPCWDEMAVLVRMAKLEYIPSKANRSGVREGC